MPLHLHHRGYLLALWVLGCGFAMHTVGNRMWVVAPWLALLLTLRFTRLTPARLGLPLGAAGWALAYCAGWAGVLPFEGWEAWAVPAMAGLIAFAPFAIDKALGRFAPYGLRWLVLPLAWVATEAAFRLAGAGTWGALAYSQHDVMPLMQGAAILGLAWPALVIASFASVANAVWDSPPSALKPAMAYGAVLILTLGIGAARPLISGTSSTPVRMAGVVVDNRDAFKATWAPLSYGKVLDADALEQARPKADALFIRLLQQTQAAADQGANMVVWSEGNALVPAVDEARQTARAQNMARNNRIWLFASMAVMTAGQSKAENVLLVIDDHGHIVDRYLKSHPTPGEASIKGNGRMGWADTPWGRVAWAICYDFDYPELVAQGGRAEAALLIDPSWDSAGMTPLHTDMARARAIENGAALFRVVNDGTNLATDAYGRELARLHVAFGQDAVWTTDLPLRRLPVVYPWLEPFVGAIAVLALALLVAIGAMRAKTVKPPHD